MTAVKVVTPRRRQRCVHSHPQKSSARLLSVAGLIAFWLGLAFPSIANAQMPNSQLSAIFPTGGRAGSEFELEIAGANLDEVDRLLFSHPDIEAEPIMIEPDVFHPAPRPRLNHFQVRIGKDVPPGIYEVRAVGRYGISNPRAFVVSELKEVLREGQPDSLDEAMPLEPGTAVNARAAQRQIDHYAIELDAGETVLIECWSRRVDSRMTPVVKLLTAGGRQLRSVRGLNGDPVLTFEAKKAGTYIVCVHDFIYGGGDEYPYRLAVHRAPWIDFVFPPSGLPGDTGEFVIYGRNLPGGEPAEGVSLNGVPLQQKTVRIAIPDESKQKDVLTRAAATDPHCAATIGTLYQLKGEHGRSNPVIIQHAVADVTVEHEPSNDDPASAEPLQVPAEYVGRFYPQGDRDWVEFEAKKGDVYWIEVFSNRLGTFADPVLTVQRVTRDNNGEEQVRVLTKVDDVPAPSSNPPRVVRLESGDPAYRLEADSDAIYRVSVHDLFNNPSNHPGLVYRLTIQKQQPDFRLVAYAEPQSDSRNQMSPSSCVLRRGGSAAMRVEVIRRNGFDGEVEIVAEGLPAGVTCRGARLGGAISDGWLVFEAQENAKPWAGPIDVIGKATIGGRQVLRPARIATMLWPAGNNDRPYARIAGDVTLSVIEKETAPAFIQAGDGKLLETSIGGKLKIPVKATTRDKLNGGLKIAAIGLPNDMKPADVTLKNNAGTVELQVKNTRVPLGTYTFYFLGTSKFKYGRNQDAVKAAEAEQKRLTDLLKEWTDRAAEMKKAADAAEKADDEAEKAVETAKKELAEAESNAKKAADEVAAAEKALEAAKKAAADAKDDKGKQDAAKKAEADLKSAQEAAQKADEAVEAARKTLAERESQRQAAQEELKTAQQQAAEAENNRKQADALKRQSDTDVRNVKSANTPKDVDLKVISSPVQVRVVAHPLDVSVKSPKNKVDQGESIEIPVTIERKYDFNDKVDIELSLPSGVRGLSARKISLDKGKSTVKLEVKADENATPGEHLAELRLQMRFNGVSLEAREPVTIEVKAVDPPKEKK